MAAIFTRIGLFGFELFLLGDLDGFSTGFVEVTLNIYLSI